MVALLALSVEMGWATIAWMIISVKTGPENSLAANPIFANLTWLIAGKLTVRLSFAPAGTPTCGCCQPLTTHPFGGILHEPL
jgi:hypothetical protein